MKIAVVTAFPRDPERPHGGVEAVSVNLVRALARRPGSQVVVVTADRELRHQQICTWSGITIHRLPAAGEKLLSFSLRRGRRQVRQILRQLQPDVVHAHDTYGLMVQGLELPRVFTVHGFIYEDTRYDTGRLPWLRAALWEWFEVRGWADQPHIVSINPFVRSQLQDRVTGTIHDIENPIDEQFFAIPRAEKAGTIFCAAGIRKLKNIMGLVQAFEKIHAAFPCARLRIAGPESDPEYAGEIRRFVAGHGLTDKVHFLGSLGSAGIRDELAAASVFSLLSFQENAPMGIAEAMAAGVPIVTSDRCGMPYMVQNGETGFLVNPEESDGTAECLRRLLQDSAMRERMGQAAHGFALDRFHPDRVAEKTFSVYRQSIRDFGNSLPLRRAEGHCNPNRVGLPG